MVVHNSEFDKSLKNLPKHALVVDRMSGLEEIASREFNLVIFPREYCEDRADFANLVNPSVVRGCGHSAYINLSNSPDHRAKKSFLEDFDFLTKLIDRLQEDTRVIYQPTNKIHEGFWHQDPGFTINYTLVGPGGLWSPNDNIKNGKPIDLNLVRQFGTQHIAIYKGEGDDNPAGPLFHSPPIRKIPEKRILMQLYE
ncbi:MAG: hypothetical protein ACMXYB_01510 [Candidatus Woesearchaeota archaeon]